MSRSGKNKKVDRSVFVYGDDLDKSYAAIEDRRVAADDLSQVLGAAE